MTNWKKEFQNSWKNALSGKQISIQQPYTDSNRDNFVIFVDDDMYAWRSGYPFREYYESYKEAKKDVLKYIGGK